MKRLMDMTFALFALAVLSPVLLLLIVVIWLQDRHSPFYIASRVGLGDKEFRMVKLRSMVIRADTSGVDSTAANDPRITPVGRFVRRYKLDEFMQMWNVLKGDMSVVGPRPNVRRETDLYTIEEQQLLTVRPGVTDIASIVFADVSEILEGKDDPDLAYNQLIRPWKSRLGILYVEHRSTFLDLRLVLLTAQAILSRAQALRGVQVILYQLGVEDDVKRVAR